MTSEKTNGDLAKPAPQYTETGELVAPWWKFWHRRRFLVSILAFFGFFNVYALRVNLSVAIVAMTSPYNVTLPDGTVEEQVEFDWDSTTRGLVLSSFFYGYLFTQVPGGWLATKIGGHRVFCVGIGVTALLTVVTPPLAKWSVWALVACRVIEGFFEGVAFPSIHALWSRWAPPMERGRLATLAYSGSYAGTVVSMPVSGLLAEYVGWESIFYVFGTLGLIWCVIWWMIVTEGPEFDPHISKEELTYIQTSLGKKENEAHKVLVYPWKSFFTSMPVYAIVVGHFSENWGFYTLLTQLPTFMKDVLGFELGKTGFLAALPYLVMTIVVQLSGHAADFILRNKYLSTTNTRKLFTCGAFVCQFTFMMAVAYLMSPAGVVTCLTLAVGLGAFTWGGFGVNHLDIAPQYAGILMGLSNTVATLPGIISPALTGVIVANKAVEEWRIVFFITSGVYIVGGIFYVIFASGERQSWALEPEKTTDLHLAEISDSRKLSELDEAPRKLSERKLSERGEDKAYVNQALEHDASDEKTKDD